MPTAHKNNIMLEKEPANFQASYKEKETRLVTLRNTNGITIQITNYGGKIVSILVPDRYGNFADIVLGYDSIMEYIKGNPYFGAICGRYANRIANGKFVIDGTEYQLSVNNGTNHLHGGEDGFSNQVFYMGEVVMADDCQSVELQYKSIHSEMGYPGNITLSVVYELNNRNEFAIRFKATTDMDTHVNICSHSFFNLAGEGSGDILNHQLLINANLYTPISELLVPTGIYASVENSPMDFRTLTRIDARINEKFEQLEFGIGYDHNWVLDKEAGQLTLAAICYEPVSGRKIEVHTTQPGIQIYSGNWLDGSDKGKGGHIYGKRSAICLETQHFPDSPNNPHFPSTLLKKDSLYNHTCIYKFSVD